jgi:hypothetical protein
MSLTDRPEVCGDVLRWSPDGAPVALHIDLARCFATVLGERD